MFPEPPGPGFSPEPPPDPPDSPVAEGPLPAPPPVASKAATQPAPQVLKDESFPLVVLLRGETPIAVPPAPIVTL